MEKSRRSCRKDFAGERRRGGLLTALTLIVAVGGARASGEPLQTASAVRPDAIPSEPSRPDLASVGDVPLRDDARIAPATRGGSRAEVAVPGEREVNVPPPAPPAGTVDPVVLADEIGQRSATLQDCRVEVARREHLAWSKVAARRLTLRWTILPSGALDKAEAVAVDPTDGALLDCVKQHMSQWTFTPPRGGSLRVARTFSFRSKQGVAFREPRVLQPAPVPRHH